MSRKRTSFSLGCFFGYNSMICFSCSLVNPARLGCRGDGGVATVGVAGGGAGGAGGAYGT